MIYLRNLKTLLLGLFTSLVYVLFVPLIGFIVLLRFGGEITYKKGKKGVSKVIETIKDEMDIKPRILHYSFA